MSRKLSVAEEMTFGEVFLRTAHNYDRDAVSRETGLFCEDVSLTKQAFAEECDINTIVRNFGLTGDLPSGVKMPQYGDFEGIIDYQTALNAVIAADESFMQLPASLRERFHHDPQNLLTFLADPSNRDAAVELGLVNRSPADAGAPLAGGAAPGGEPKAKEGAAPPADAP